MAVTGANRLVTFWKEKNDKYSLQNILDLQKRRYIPFIGSGMSVPFGYPDWKHFLLSIVDEYFDAEDEVRIEAEKMLSMGKYLLAAEKINSSLNNGITEEVRKTFNKRAMSDVPIECNYLKLLSSTGIKTFVTTNFDGVIEENLKICAENIYLPSSLSKSGDVLEALRVDEGCVIKLHGTYDRPDSIILTESDFNSVYGMSNTVLTQTFDFLWNSSVLLFLGCGLTKDYLLDRIVQLAGAGRHHWHYAILAYPGENVTKVKKEMTRLKIRPIWFEPGKFEQIQVILKMIVGIDAPTDDSEVEEGKAELENKASVQIRSTENTKLKYFDHLANQVKDDLELQNKLAKAILSQNEDYKIEYSKQRDIIGGLLNKILTSTNCYPLSIIGEPGTGKSTILSLIFYRCLQTSQDVNCFLVDTHYYDKQIRLSAREDLENYLKGIDESIRPNEKAIIFVDGINRYVRGDKTLEDIISRWIKKWKANQNIKFVIVIGELNDILFPPFKHRDERSLIAGISDCEIHLHPVANEDSAQRELISTTKMFFSKANNIKENKANTYVSDKLSHYCKRIGGRTTDFRTIYFILKELYSAPSKESFFHTDIGATFNSYFHKINDERTMLETAKYTALRLLQKTPRKPKKFYYLFKSEAIRNFFFAYHYIHVLNQCNIKELMLFDCIFTPGINRFAVDLMLNQSDCGKRIIENINQLIKRNDITINQKNQMAFLLGRVTNKICKNQAIEILSQEYKAWDWKKRLTTSTALYIRTVGISLVYLGSTMYTNSFFEKLIYNGFLSRINRNFHIQYFLKDGYRFESELKLDDAEMCSADNIDALYKYLYHSIFDQKPRKESICINIITILNLTVYRIFYLGQNSEKDIVKAQNLISALLSSKVNLSNNLVLKYVDNVKRFIENGNVYISTLANIYNLKETQRAGWIAREINKKRRTESVADHTWACCQLALLFLPDNTADCKFADISELHIMGGEYSLSRVIQMLIVHDLGEAYTGDILSGVKNEDNIQQESEVIRNLVTLDTLPHFGTFGYIDNLVKEFKELKTYDAKLARDIDLIEPLIQLFIYRKDLNSYSCDAGIQERDDWVKSVESQLNTAFGKNLLAFLISQVLCHFEI